MSPVEKAVSEERHRHPWNPQLIRRQIRSIKSAAQAMEVDTDAGRGYAKLMGGPEGDHLLACEWLGTRLASELGLRTFDIAIVRFSGTPELRFQNGELAKPGPAFVSRAEEGHTWGGEKEELEQLSNPGDISRLVVFDTWTRNCDRHFVRGLETRKNVRNVFFSEEDAPEGRFFLKAMDHTHCFTCGRKPTPAVKDSAHDDAIYGLFDEFHAFIDRKIVDDAVKGLREVSEDMLRTRLHEIPPAWGLDESVKAALAAFLLERAGFVARSIAERIPPQQDFWGNAVR